MNKTTVFCTPSVLALLLTFFGHSSAHGTSLKLIQGGKVTAAVVIPDAPTDLEAHAGEMICKYLAQMAGTSEIPRPAGESQHKTASGSTVILLGRAESSKRIEKLVDGGKLKLSATDPGGDGIVIKTISDGGGNTLVLGGSSNRAVLHAVVHFLERYAKVGVFWDGTYVPDRKNFSVENIDIHEKPHFPVRQYGQGCAYSYSYMFWWDLEQRKEHLDWAAFKKQTRLMFPEGGLESHEHQSLVDAQFTSYLDTEGKKSIAYGRQNLGLEFIGADGKDKIQNRDPFPESRVSDNPEEEDRIIRKFVVDMLAEKGGDDVTWYASGWALFNPGWRIETAKKFFDTIGDSRFYICDIWGEVHPIYKKFDYFYGKDWGFGVLHSFGGSTTLHGDVSGLIRKSQDVANDPRATRCIAYYINPEVILYNDFYFDLAAQLSWRPREVELDSFIEDYVERRYGAASKPNMAEAYRELAKSVYGTDDRTSPFWQGRVGKTFSSVGTTRLTYIPRLARALELLLEEAPRQGGNALYGKDLIDVSKQLLAEVANGYLYRFYNAYAWKDEQAFKESAVALRLCLDLVEKLLSSRKGYYIRPVLDHIYAYPGMDEKQKKGVETYFKDAVMTFALRENLRDYNRRDHKELFDLYHRPRADAYIEHLEKKFAAKDFEFDPGELLETYVAIEKAWMENSLPPFTAKIRPGQDVEAARETLATVQKLSGAIAFDSSSQIQNGGFETGRPAGWRVSVQNMDVNISSEFKTFTGFTDENLYALHFVADEQSRYKTFTAEQKIKWHEKNQVSMDYLISKCTSHANAHLKLTGTCADGKTGVQILYFWGGDSWDTKNATPKETGSFYSAAYELKAPRDKWQRLERVPARDFDTVHGEGKWKSLGVDTVTLTIGCWVREEHKNSAQGWMDELKITRPVE